MLAVLYLCLDPASPFEVAYLDMLKKAARNVRKEIGPQTDGTPLELRFGDYCDSMPAWEHLKATAPCAVDESVTVWFGY